MNLKHNSKVKKPNKTNIKRGKVLPRVRLELTAFRLWDWRAAYCATEAWWFLKELNLYKKERQVVQRSLGTFHSLGRKTTPFLSYDEHNLNGDGSLGGEVVVIQNSVADTRRKVSKGLNWKSFELLVRSRIRYFPISLTSSPSSSTLQKLPSPSNVGPALIVLSSYKFPIEH